MAGRVQCPDCERDFANAGALRFHRIAKHGADAGHCDVCDKDFDRLSQHVKKMHAPGASPSSPAGAEIADRAAPAGADPLDAERAPLIPDGIDLGDDDTRARPKLSDRVRAKLWGRSSPADVDAPAPPSSSATTRGERPPRVKVGKRSTTAPIGSMVWGFMGMGLERTGVDIPVGRTMQFQSELAGDTLDRLIAGTWLDRALQPFASKTDELEQMVALFALPVCVGLIERSPAAAATLEPVLREAVRANITGMAPVVKKRKASDAKFAAAAAELGILDGMPEGVDPIDAMLGMIFAPPPNAPPAPPADDAANNGHDTAGTRAPA